MSIIVSDFVDKRNFAVEQVESDVVVVGGGLSGVCAAISAAREGATVSLIQDRPVLGGNASSEVRVWVLGATSHMGNNNRWSREGGIIDEILLENLYRNREGNPLFFDMVLMDKVLNESNIKLFLNTSLFDVEKSDSRTIKTALAFNPQNQKRYEFTAHTFVDASGDGVLGYLAGAGFRVGSEDAEMYGERFAPSQDYGEVLGHSIFFYSKECKEPVEFHAPDFALKDAEQFIPKLNNPNYFNIKQHGCKYWWLEYGGRLDTIGDTEQIKHELWRVVYGVWDYIKNSGKFPETACQTLEWVGAISGKRESRRFYGAYDLIQQDVIEQRYHYDAVAYGGWSIDLHPADAIYSPLNGCNQWHSKGVYQIPYRCYVGRDIDNMFLCGRNISATHVAHASSRVMCTAALGGEAVGVAAALCAKNELLPKDYIDQERVKEIQRTLIKRGGYIPALQGVELNNLLNTAELKSSSTLEWGELPAVEYRKLKDSVAQLIPSSGQLPTIRFSALAATSCELEVVLRRTSKSGNFTPDIDVESKRVELKAGENSCAIDFEYTSKDTEYLFITFMKNEDIELGFTPQRISGTVAVYNTINLDVSNYGRQTPTEDIGVDAFEFWCPKRWDSDGNIALSFSPALRRFGVENLRNNIFRPAAGANCWVAAASESEASLELKWQAEQTISAVSLYFDGDANQALENNQMGHLLNRVPECVKSFTIENDRGEVIASVENNHLSCCTVKLTESIKSKSLVIRLQQTDSNVAISLFGVVVE